MNQLLTTSRFKLWQPPGRVIILSVVSGLASLLLILLLVGGVPAQNERDFTFRGSGFGHGVGLSQWGARGQAIATPDKPGEEIAATYYPGSEPASMADLNLPNDYLTSLETPLWVNIVSEVTILEFTAVGGPLELCLAGDGEGECPKSEQPQVGERWEFRRLSPGRCAFFQGGVQQGTEGECRASVEWPEAEGIIVRHGEDRIKPCLIPAENECEYHYGVLKMRDDPVELGFHVLLSLSLEDYLKGVNEIRWEEPGVNEALVVAARSYAAFRFFQQDVEPRPPNREVDPGIGTSRQDSCWCHLYDNSRDMVYVGWAKEQWDDSGAWLAAVESTAGRVLTYSGENADRITKGGIIQGFFSTSSGGLTNSNVYGFFTEWNGRTPSVNEWPYLAAVEDPWSVDDALNNPHANWSKTISADTIARLLGWDQVSDAVLVNEPTVAHPATVRFEGRDNDRDVSVTVAGSWLDTTLGLKSSVVRSINDRPPETTTPTSTVTTDPEETTPTTVPVVEFSDISDSVHADAIRAIATAGLTVGCGDGTNFCPSSPVSRGAMATFIARALDLTPLESWDGWRFQDVDPQSSHSGSIHAIAAQGFTNGCGDGTTYCPDDLLTRAGMAVLLARALDLNLDRADGGLFADVGFDHPAERYIAAIAYIGVTVGCGDGTNFCPDAVVTRGSMATFLYRAFDLSN